MKWLLTQHRPFCPRCLMEQAWEITRPGDYVRVAPNCQSCGYYVGGTVRPMAEVAR